MASPTEDDPMRGRSGDPPGSPSGGRRRSAPPTDRRHTSSQPSTSASARMGDEDDVAGAAANRPRAMDLPPVWQPVGLGRYFVAHSHGCAVCADFEAHYLRGRLTAEFMAAHRRAEDDHGEALWAHWSRTSTMNAELEDARRNLWSLQAAHSDLENCTSS